MDGSTSRNVHNQDLRPVSIAIARGNEPHVVIGECPNIDTVGSLALLRVALEKQLKSELPPQFLFITRSGSSVARPRERLHRVKDYLPIVTIAEDGSELKEHMHEINERKKAMALDGLGVSVEAMYGDPEETRALSKICAELGINWGVFGKKPYDCKRSDVYRIIAMKRRPDLGPEPNPYTEPGTPDGNTNGGPWSDAEDSGEETKGGDGGGAGSLGRLGDS